MKRLGLTIFVLAFVSGIIGLGVVIGSTLESGPDGRTFTWALASLIFGALVGLSEILSRYRDEPLRASTTNSGLAYLLLNGMISVAAFALLRRYAEQIFPTIKDDLFLTAIIAGFGGMTVFRSKLFTFRSPDGKEYAIGPAIVLETILKTIDQKIDRQRATERQDRVYRAMGKFSDFENTAKYIEASLNSFQNLTQEQKAEVSNVLEDYRQIEWPSSLKILALGFAFLNIAGEENFDHVVANLTKYLEGLDSHTERDTEHTS